MEPSENLVASELAILLKKKSLFINPKLLKKEMASHSGPQGYDPTLDDSKSKTKSVKRNERKKEK
ncbi:hypothetical protein HN51_038042 [Arachis hypogaea]